MRCFIVRLLPIVALVALMAGVAHACPMCNQSIAEENYLPRAYMYSILFMLGMPATVFGGFGLSLFLAFRKHQAAGQPLVAQASAGIGLPVAEVFDCSKA